MILSQKLSIETSFHDCIPSDIHHSYCHPNISVAQSTFIQHQKALICNQFICQNELLFYYKDDFTRTRTRTSIQIGKDIHLEAGNIGSNMNHSCEPNSYIRTYFNAKIKKGAVAVFAMRDIFQGEEITFDYGTTETDLTKEIQKTLCLCGNRKCRKKIHSFPELPVEIQLEYLKKNYLADHIVKEYLFKPLKSL